MKIDFDKWVNDNNLDMELSYRKGWWDYIEFVRELDAKFKFVELNVISTYVMETPPPTEELLMPVIKLTHENCSFILKTVFGPLPPYWNVSIERNADNRFNVIGLFNEKIDHTNENIPGFEREWIYPSYFENPRRFTCQLDDEWDVYALIRLVVFNA